MKLLSSLNLPSVSKHSLCSDLTMWLVYLFLDSSTGLQSSWCSVCSQQLFCISVLSQLVNTCLYIYYISPGFPLKDCSWPRPIYWSKFHAHVHPFTWLKGWLWMEESERIPMLPRRREVVLHPCLLKRVICNLSSMGILKINSPLTFLFVK